MPLPLQSKMLRVLQEQTFQRVGGNDTIQTDVRIIAASHRDLRQAAETGRFRPDLYYRLNVFEIALPPLRDRLDDLDLLVEHFLARTRLELDKSVSSVSVETLEVLRAYAWPGNIRELQSVIKQAVLKSVGPVLIPDFLPEFVTGSGTATSHTDSAASDFSVDSRAVIAPVTSAPDPSPVSSPAWSDWGHFVAEQVAAGSHSVYDDAVRLTEKHVISLVLTHTSGNQAQASEVLGITRTTLRNKIKQHSITIGRTVEANE